ncbi:MAG: hypothetical protein J6E31_08745 [Pyramidobacter sp.]|nr:hypothetical protein [Pyramidobacter sp.]
MHKPDNGLISGTQGDRLALIEELRERSEKFTEANIVFITHDQVGRIVWLETGKAGMRGAGLAHIVERHAKEFAKIGITEAQIPQYIMHAIQTGTIIAHQGVNRPVYEFVFRGQTHRLAITTGRNGFIVGANPRSIPKE